LIVAFDNTFLTLVFNPNARPTPNPGTGKPVDKCKERIEALIDKHSRQGDTVVVATPCLAELLTGVPDVAKALGEITGSASFLPASFDARCAIELAEITRAEIRKGDKKGGVAASWNEIKFDRQIAVIAKINGATVFYTDDIHQAHIAQSMGMTVQHTWNLHLPPEQKGLEL